MSILWRFSFFFAVVIHLLGSVSKALEAVYPETPWHTLKKVSLGQKQILYLLKSVNPLHSKVIKMNYKHPQLIRDTSHTMELDFYVPDLELAFEYQGAQHYSATYQNTISLPAQKKKDEEKRQACKQHGITLVEIPYWFDGTVDTLISTIHKQRPDIHMTPLSRSPFAQESPAA